MMSYRKMIRGFSKRIYKLAFQKDLNRQEDYIREEYDTLVEDIVSEVPIKCPVYQCGAYMKTVVRRPPKDFTYEDEYDGNEQTPDMVCTDCNAKYKFDGFKKRRGKKKWEYQKIQ